MSERYVTGTDATRLRQLVNKQATAGGRPLPWPSEDHNGNVIVGSVGTTSIRDTVEEAGRVLVYVITGREQGLMDAGRNGRSRLTASEQLDLTDIEGRVQER